MQASSSAIAAITFDLDDTLWETWPTIERAERLLHEWLLANYPEIPRRFSSRRLRDQRQRVLAKQPEIAHDLSRLRREGLKLAANEAGYQQFDDEAAFAVFHTARNEVQYFEDALPVLQKLAERYSLVALSNGNADLRLVGLDHLFAFGLSAADVGKAKPSPDMFHAALDRLCLPYSRVVHIGDDPYNDVQGAIDAGLGTIWLNRSGKPWPHDDFSPHAEIQSLVELEAVLAAW